SSDVIEKEINMEFNPYERKSHKKPAACRPLAGATQLTWEVLLQIIIHKFSTLPGQKRNFLIVLDSYYLRCAYV
ncbi:MAG: hypothetical protein KJ638_03375, partial [Chloroflexi bacterium]|nr:hypothetical protein [Chloroflexota bacterium]